MNRVLKWDGHLQNLDGLFQKLQRDCNLVDVTMACKEGSLKAHKLVLCACSPFFERVIMENPSKHPVLIMRGVSLSEMQKLTAFMYRGMLEVHENEVNNLIKIGEDLEIRGISEISVEKFDDRRDTRFKGRKRVAVDHSPMRDRSPEVAAFLQRVQHQKSPQNEIEIQPRKKTVHFQLPPQHRSSSSSSSSTSSVTSTSALLRHLQHQPQPQPQQQQHTQPPEPAPSADQLVEVKMENPKDAEDPNCLLVRSKSYLPCSVCCKPFEDEETLNVHIQNAHMKKYKCDLCTISFSRSSHLERHRRTHTGERPFQCTKCDRDFSRQDKLRQHIRTSHCEPVQLMQVKKVQIQSRMVQYHHRQMAEQQERSWHPSSDEKRKRGRPRKYPPKVIDPFVGKRKRGRPRKVPEGEAGHVSDGGGPSSSPGPSSGASGGENYDLASLPFGDFSYLMMAHQDPDYSVVEPVVEIATPDQSQTLPAAPPAEEAPPAEKEATETETDEDVESGEAEAVASTAGEEEPAAVSASESEEQQQRQQEQQDNAPPPETGIVVTDSVGQIGECTIRAVTHPPPPTLIA